MSGTSQGASAVHIVTPLVGAGELARVASGLEQPVSKMKERTSLTVVAHLVVDGQTLTRPSDGAIDGQEVPWCEADSVAISSLLGEGQTWEELVQQQLEMAAAIKRKNEEGDAACNAAQWWQDCVTTQSSRKK